MICTWYLSPGKWTFLSQSIIDKKQSKASLIIRKFQSTEWIIGQRPSWVLGKDIKMEYAAGKDRGIKMDNLKHISPTGVIKHFEFNIIQSTLQPPPQISLSTNQQFFLSTDPMNKTNSAFQYHFFIRWICYLRHLTSNMKNDHFQ